VIHGFNSTLLRELEERTDERTWNENSVIGDIFVRMVDPQLPIATSLLTFFRPPMVCVVEHITQSSFLRVYASYNANYAKALLTIKQCKQQKKFNEFLEVRCYILPLLSSSFLSLPQKINAHVCDCEQSVGKGNEKRKQFVGFDLQSFLITPVQRIPRYIILLKVVPFDSASFSCLPSPSPLWTGGLLRLLFTRSLCSRSDAT